MNTPIVTIFGGSGFVGRYVAHRMAKAGWRVRVAVRRPNEAIFVRTYGGVGQVEPVLANIRNAASVARAIAGAEAVVNCVGILMQGGKQSFDAVHGDAPGSIGTEAAKAGVKRLIHISAIGADADSDSKYARSKAAGEAAVLKAFPKAVILRPSIVFGVEDEFFNRFAAMARLSPVLPLVGAETKFQPVFVDDIAAAVEAAITNPKTAGVYELGGPEVATFRALVERMLKLIRRERIIAPLPFWLARFKGRGFDIVRAATGGLMPVPFTHDQVVLLATDNVVGAKARGFKALGLEATPMEAVLESYLASYRPQGQFTAITASAKRLRPQK